MVDWMIVTSFQTSLSRVYFAGNFSLGHYYWIIKYLRLWPLLLLVLDLLGIATQPRKMDTCLPTALESYDSKLDSIATALGHECGVVMLAIL